MTTKLQLYITTPISSSSSAVPSESSTMEIRGRSAGQGCEFRWKMLGKKAGTNFHKAALRHGGQKSKSSARLGNALERKRKNDKQSDEALSAHDSCRGVTGKSMPSQLLAEAAVWGVAPWREGCQSTARRTAPAACLDGGHDAKERDDGLGEGPEGALRLAGGGRGV
jgi:hypothetical protein